MSASVMFLFLLYFFFFFLSLVVIKMLEGIELLVEAVRDELVRIGNDNAALQILQLLIASFVNKSL